MGATPGAEEPKPGKGAPPKCEQDAKHQQAHTDGAPIRDG